MKFFSHLYPFRLSRFFSINSLALKLLALRLSPLSLSLCLFHFSLNSFPPSAYIYIYSVLYVLPVFPLSLPSFCFSLCLSLRFILFFHPPQHDRPSFSLTHGISLCSACSSQYSFPPLFSRGALSLSLSLSLPFFPSLRSYPYLPAIIRFHWPSVPRRGNSGERLPYLHVWG